MLTYDYLSNIWIPFFINYDRVWSISISGIKYYRSFKCHYTFDRTHAFTKPSQLYNIYMCVFYFTVQFFFFYTNIGTLDFVGFQTRNFTFFLRPGRKHLEAEGMQALTQSTQPLQNFGVFDAKRPTFWHSYMYAYSCASPYFIIYIYIYIILQAIYSI